MWEIRVTDLYKEEQKILELTRTEAQVLNIFLTHPNLIYSAKDLADLTGAKVNYIYNQLVPRLMKITDLPLKPVRGEGWMWYEYEEKGGGQNENN